MREIFPKTAKRLDFRVSGRFSFNVLIAESLRVLKHELTPAGEVGPVAALNEVGPVECV
jgi:hypothetical protein